MSPIWRFEFPPTQAGSLRRRSLFADTGAQIVAQVIRFLLSGGVATFIHWAVMGLFVSLGEQPTFATAIGALLGSIFNYLFQ